MRIAVYPGSFDPMHIGHLAILRLLCGCGRFDSVLLIVSPRNPLKDENQSLNAAKRLADAREVIARHTELDKVAVDDIEFTLPSPSYTINTLDALGERHPDDSLTLIIGADNLRDLRKWKDYAGILTRYGVAVFPRDGIDTVEIRKSLEKECRGAKIELLEAPEVCISSTSIRESVAEGQDVSAFMA